MHNYTDNPDINELIEKGDIHWHDDVGMNERHIRCGKPLTDAEKKRLAMYLTITMFPMKIVFDN